MLDSETEQTNSADDAQGRSEADNSGDSELETLLNNFQEQTQQETKPKAEPKASPEPRVVRPDLSKLDPVIRFAEAAMKKEQRETFEKDVDAAVDRISSGEAFEGLPKKTVRRFLISHAFDNSDFDKAFQNRADNPAAWDAALKDAQSVLAEEIKEIPLAREEKNDRDDIEAAKAAVQDVSDSENDDSGPSVAEMASMSDAAFNQFISEELAKVN